MVLTAGWRVSIISDVLRVLLAAAGALVVAATGVQAESRTIAGEVVAVRCYEQTADNVGDAHVDCALSCAKRGATLGVLTDDGLYIITGEYTGETNRRLIEFVARNVEATGEVTERAGRRTIRVRVIKLRSP